jgi:hypothetical protein
MQHLPNWEVGQEEVSQKCNYNKAIPIGSQHVNFQKLTFSLLPIDFRLTFSSFLF